MTNEEKYERALNPVKDPYFIISFIFYGVFSVCFGLGLSGNDAKLFFPVLMMPLIIMAMVALPYLILPHSVQFGTKMWYGSINFMLGCAMFPIIFTSSFILPFMSRGGSMESALFFREFLPKVIMIYTLMIVVSSLINAIFWGIKTTVTRKRLDREAYTKYFLLRKGLNPLTGFLDVFPYNANFENLYVYNEKKNNSYLIVNVVLSIGFPLFLLIKYLAFPISRNYVMLVLMMLICSFLVPYSLILCFLKIVELRSISKRLGMPVYTTRILLRRFKNNKEIANRVNQQVAFKAEIDKVLPDRKQNMEIKKSGYSKYEDSLWNYYIEKLGKEKLEYIICGNNKEYHDERASETAQR